MENLPLSISLVFGLITFCLVGLFYKASHYSKSTLLLLISWLIIQSILGLSGCFLKTDAMPPRLLLAVLPTLLLIFGLFATTTGRQFIDRLDLKTLTLLHTLRIPIEMVLYGLFVYKKVPELMTFAGSNYDILSGITAGFVFYFGFIQKKLSTKIILIWNFICLGLLLNIVMHAVLAAPFPFQQLAFEQANVAVLYFPFNWLPTCVVPMVLFSHLAGIRILLNTKSQ
ncbi:MAG: hypothetical protein IPK91_00950 [Saprospiraceae bacterium]|nr:hypothetical protein [Saprospiraceae bacterium]